MNKINKFIRKIGKKVTSNILSAKIYYFLCEVLTYLMSDELYIKLMYRIRVGRRLDLDNPKRFSEKIQWLKLNHHDPLLTTLVDKYRVRDYIKEKIGEKYLIPLLGIYNSFSEIDFDKLPNRFILKTNHGSGWVIPCPDKSKFNVKEAEKKINLWLKTNYYFTNRSWPYKNVKPVILCEEFLSTGNLGLDDYKIHCFNGEPRYIQFIRGRFGKMIEGAFYDLNWNKQEFILTIERINSKVIKPINFVEMIEISKKLSKDLPYARIDLYNPSNHIYFGEVTLHSVNGMDKFDPDKYDEIFGDLIDLNMI